jgi:hypothetical protein
MQPMSSPAATRAETVQPAIPYRKDSGGLAGTAGGAMFAAIAMLAIFMLALRYAHRKGLLNRWVVATPKGSAQERPTMHVEQALRIGPKTMVYRIRDGSRRYLLVESAAHTQLTEIRDDNPTNENESADAEDL